MSRRAFALVSCLSAPLIPSPLTAQQSEQPIDLSANEAGQAAQDCSREQDAATISGEIVVCRRLRDDGQHRLRPAKDAQQRYAQATMYDGDPQAPALMAPPCDPKTIGCFRLGSAPPPAYMIDFAALPEAPPGSDADRIARGLAPIGQDEPSEPPAADINPSVSASPAEAP